MPNVKNVLNSGMGKILKRNKMSTPKRSKKEASDDDSEIDVTNEAKTYIEKFLGDVSKTTATKQIIIGATTGWATGVVTVKIGKVAACAIGGSIIIMQIAAHQGYIKVNWDKIMTKAEKISDKVEEKITGEGPNLMDKVERFVDRKVDKAEQLLKKGQRKTRRWYHTLIGDENSFYPNEFHYFLVSFVAGVALGVATGN